MLTWAASFPALELAITNITQSVPIGRSVVFRATVPDSSPTAADFQTQTHRRESKPHLSKATGLCLKFCPALLREPPILSPSPPPSDRVSISTPGKPGA